MTSTKVMQIYDDGRVDVEGVVTGEKETLKADTVILAGGMRPVKGCETSMQNRWFLSETAVQLVRSRPRSMMVTLQQEKFK